MIKGRFFALGSVLVLVVAGLVWAQARKAGLWEYTTTQTWQQSPMPPGLNIPNSPFSGGTHTSQVCLTQQQVDKFGTVPPQARDCQMTNITKTAEGMTGDLVCSGRISGKGRMEASFVDSDHAKVKIHFTGAAQMGANSKPIEWTMNSSSIFKSADCGSVKPSGATEK